MDEALEEELEIMEDRAKPRAALSVESFELEIAEVCGRPAEAVEITATVGHAVERMQKESIGSVVIVEGGRTVGILTERDLLTKVIGRGEGWSERPVAEIMTAAPETLQRHDAIKYLLHRMHVGGFRHVPIVDDEGRPLHVVGIRDVLAYVLEHFDQEIATTPSLPFRG